MSSEWTSSGPELLLPVDRSSRDPLRCQLERGLRQAIRSGRLAPGQLLPSSRVLARDLGVSRGLVTECYLQLRTEGYLSTRPGSGTRVAPAARRPSGDSARSTGDTTPRIDFRPGLPDLSSFPRQEWSRAIRRAGQRATAGEFGYADPAGNRVLREALAAYLGRVRGAVTRTDDVVVCAGFAQGLRLVLDVLADAGLRTVAVEDPGDPEYLALAGRLGLEIVPVPVDGDGLDVAALAATGAGAVVLTPAHQSPTGVVLSPERRQAIVSWAARRGATIIEDDYDAEFRYDRQPLGALQGLAPDHVVLVGSTSKSLAPALRLGWVLCPPTLSDAVSAAKDAADRGSPVLDQLALAHLVDTGQYDRHLRRMRRRYAARRSALVDALRRHAPHVALHGLAAGFHAVAELPPGRDEQAVVAAARRRAVGLYPMSRYRLVPRPGPPRLVLGFGNLTEDAIREGVSAVADLLGGVAAGQRSREK